MPTTPPTKEAFDKLLLCLSPDRERAGEEYELLRLKLLEYFRSRAYLSAEELADETLNRLARKIAEGEDIREMVRYCYGLARWIWVEHSRNPHTKEIAFDNLPVLPFSSPDHLVQKERLDCFRHCLGHLTTEEREMVIRYWDHEDQPHSEPRREQAEQMGLTPTALRIRISRIKNRLKACFANCMERGLKNLK